MTIMEIALLIIGILVFVASFRIPVRKEEKIQTESLGEEEIQKLVQAQLEESSSKVLDSVDEAVVYAVEKAEHSLDKLTNEKIMAVNEYADTVLADIHKNHEEVVFLYDMLNDKQTQLKNTVMEAEQTAKTVSKTAKQAEETVTKTAKQAEETVSKTAKQAEETVSKTTKQAEEIINRVQQAEETTKETVKAAEEAKADEKTISGQKDFQPFVVPSVSRTEVKQQPENNKRKKTTVPNTKKAEDQGQVDEQAARRTMPQGSASSVEDTSDAGIVERNKNEEILALHKAGKSNMVIARELGLGVGEVKLVIDLFKGI